MITPALQAAALWSGLTLLLLMGLSLAVVFARRRHKVLVGDGALDDMTRPMRAFGNATEYVAPVLIALVLLALLDAPAWWVHVLGAAFFVGRLIHAYGLSGSTGVTPARVLGMAFTWTVMLLAALALIYLGVT